MADISLAVQQISRSGLNAAYTVGLSAADAYTVRNDGQTVLHFKKGAGTPSVITVQTPLQVDGLDLEELTATVPINDDLFLGPFPPGTFNDPTFLLRFTVTEVGNLTVAALRI